MMADWLEEYHRQAEWVDEVFIKPEDVMPEDYAVVLGRRGSVQIVKLGWKDEDEDDDG
jgi:hypothetical protein